MHSLKVVILSLLTISCGQSATNSHVDTTTTSTVKTNPAPDSSGDPQIVPKEKVNGDISINSKLVLWKPDSVEKYLGDIKDKFIENDTDGLYVYFKNTAGSEYLRLIHLPGGSTGTITYFEVGLVKSLPAKTKLYESEFPAFFTEHGIKLGIDRSTVIQQFGKNYEEKKKGKGESISYQQDLGGLHYSAVYYFKDAKLVKFGFGYDNP